MNDRAALEVALAANPDDFATHAAYADLLAEQGDPRGDFIRLQLALEDRKQPAERLRAMEQEAAQLRRRHEPDWIGPLAEFANLTGWRNPRGNRVEVRRPNVEFTYRRGWLDTLRVRTLSRAVATALSGCPTARLLADLEVVSYRMSDLLPLLPLANLVRLRWSEGDEEPDRQPGEGGPGWFHDVAPTYFPAPADFSPAQLPRLRSLSLRWQYRGDDGVRFLLATGLLGRLQSLDLRECAITDDGAQALAAHPAVPKLDDLHLDDNHISPVGIDALAAVGVVISQRQHLGPTPGGGDEPADGEIEF